MGQRRETTLENTFFLFFNIRIITSLIIGIKYTLL